MFAPRNIKQKITALVSLTVSTLTLDATILTFEIENKKFENYQSMPQEYGDHVNSQKSLSVDGLHHYIYKEGNNWTPDISVQYSSMNTKEFPTYFGNIDGDTVWTGLCFLWSESFESEVPIGTKMPVGFEYYITLTPDVGSGKSIVLNSFVLNDYIEYFAINTSDQVTEWKIVRGTPTGTVLVSGTVTNHDGDVLTINTGMTLAQSTGDPLVLVLKRLVGTEDDLGIDDINFDQITQLRHTATGAIPSGFTGSPLANVVIDETTKTVTADIPTIGPQGYLTIDPAVTIISTQVQGGKLVVTFD